MGVFQLPFLIGCVSLTFVTPQLIGIYTSSTDSDLDIWFSTLFFTLCNLGLFWGFKYASLKDFYTYRLLNNSNTITVSIIFVIIGVVAYILNRGVYRGGFVSGIYVIINFFTSYLSYALLLISLYTIKDGIAEKRKIILILFTIIILINLDKFIITARRAEAIQFVLIISFLFLSLPQINYNRWKIIIPLFFLVGMLLGSQIGKYRENAYNDVSFTENIETLDYNFSNIWIGSNDAEIHNAIIGINNVENTGNYDYGAFNWNSFIGNYVPKVIFGDEFKQKILIGNGKDATVAYLTRSGSTMTGYYDSFLAFGLFGFVKFIIIGFIMGFIWKKAQVSEYYYLPYFGTVTAALHIITHSSGNFVSALFFWFVFVSPFIKYDKYYKYDD